MGLVEPHKQRHRRRFLRHRLRGENGKLHGLNAGGWAPTGLTPALGLHRAAYDLMGYQPDQESSAELPRGTSLYGSLPEQLRDGTSFVSRLRKVLAVRTRYGIASSTQLDVPSVSDGAMLVMVHLLGTGQIQVTALNFSRTTIFGSVMSDHLPIGGAVTDAFTDQQIGTVDQARTFPILLDAHQGRALIIDPAAAAPLGRADPGPARRDRSAR